MAQITLKILGNTTSPNNGIDAVISKIKQDLKSLEQPIKIIVDASGLDAATKTLQEATKALGGQSSGGNSGAAAQMREIGRATEAAAAQFDKYTKVLDVADDGTKTLRREIEDVTTALGRQVQTIKEYDAAGEEVVSTTEKITTNQKEQRKYTQEANEAYRKYVAEIEASKPETAIQKQINALTGVSNQAKSAAESASVFDKALSNLEAKVSGTTKALSAEEKAMLSAEVQTKSYAEGLGKVINHQEKMVDGNVIEAMTEYRDEVGNVTKIVSKLDGAEVKTTQTIKQATEATKKQADASELLSKKNSLLGDSLDRIIAKVSAWQLINWAVSSAIGAFRDAIETIKQVDTELVTIRKTTDLTEQEIGQLTDRTYELAAAYGRTADELLGLTSTFARAGLHDQLDEMTELAALLENVGDIEGDTAAKFILAANAAWQLQGNYESLMAIIDGMNAVTNQAAVDMEALTTGITVAGSVFANAGETAQTYTALVGTAVAATQRSGSEVARGLRTIAMNIRSIKGELEDGEIIDEASISDAAAALHSVGISVADANGELRLTSDVLSDLAGKWEELTTAEQAYLAESLAGKRQANVLTALMQNWSEVSRQMTLYANGAGSALQENEIYLDSWEAKTKQLSAAWTNLVQSFVETRGIKDAIGGLTDLINTLDKLSPILDVILPMRWKNLPDDIKEIFGEAKSETDILNAAIDENNEKIAENNALIKEANEIGGDPIYVQNLVAQNQQLLEANERLREQLGVTEELTEAEKELNKERAIGIAQKYGVREYSASGATRALENLYNNPEGYDKESFVTAERELKQLIAFFDTYTGVVEEASEAEVQETQSAYDAAMAHRHLGEATEESASKVRDFTTSAESLNQNALPAFKALKAVYDEVQESGTVSFSTLASLSEQFKDVDGIDRYISRLINIGTSGEDVSSILTELAYQLLVNKDYSEALAGSSQALIAAMLDEAGVANSTRVAMDLLATAIATANNSELDFATQISELKKLAIAAGVAATTVAAIGRPEILKPSQMKNGLVTDAGTGGGTTVEKLMSLISNQVESLVFKEPEVQSTGSSRGSGTTRTTKAADDPELEAIKLQIEAHKDKVALLKSELSLMKERGDSEEDIVAKMREIQAAEHDSAEYMRENQDRWAELKIDQTDVNALSLDWWKIQKDINDLLEETVELREDELDLIQSSIALEKQQLDFLEESGKSTEEQIDQIKVIQAKLHEEAELRRQNLQILKDSGASASEIADAESDILKLSTEWWNYQNQITKLLEKEAQESEKKRTELIKQAKEEALALLEAQEEAEKGPLQKQLELLEGQKDALSAEREEAEKLLAVEKAREALANAQNERTVRQYNARTGQWEWVANASNVAKAQENLANAEQALADYYAKREIDDLKARIAEVGNTYDQLRDAVNDFADAVQNGKASWDEAQDFLLAAIGDFGGAVVQSAVNAANAFNAIVGGVTGDPDQAGSGGQSSGSGSGVTAKKFKNLTDITLGDGTTVTDLAALAFSGGNAIEAYRDENGVGDYYLTHARTRAYSSYDGEDTLAYLAAGVKAGQITKQQAANLLSELTLDTTLMDNRRKMATLYKGYTLFNGGSSLLRLSDNTSGLNSTASNYAAYLRSMGIVTSSGESYAGFGGVTNNRIGTQNNGDTYQFGNISLSEQQARSMTVYDLANMAGELSLHNPAV